MIPTIFVIGRITILSVSDENMIEPIHIMIHVKIVVPKESIASASTELRTLYLTKTYNPSQSQDLSVLHYFGV